MNYSCLRCMHVWIARQIDTKPKRCPRCGVKHFDTPPTYKRYNISSLTPGGVMHFTHPINQSTGLRNPEDVWNTRRAVDAYARRHGWIVTMFTSPLSLQVTRIA